MNKQTGLLLTLLFSAAVQLQADASTPGIVIAHTLLEKQRDAEEKEQSKNDAEKLETGAPVVSDGDSAADTATSPGTPPSIADDVPEKEKPKNDDTENLEMGVPAAAAATRGKLNQSAFTVPADRGVRHVLENSPTGLSAPVSTDDEASSAYETQSYFAALKVVSTMVNDGTDVAAALAQLPEQLRVNLDRVYYYANQIADTYHDEMWEKANEEGVRQIIKERIEPLMDQLKDDSLFVAPAPSRPWQEWATLGGTGVGMFIVGLLVRGGSAVSKGGPPV
jgi:hypothetical protein